MNHIPHSKPWITKNEVTGLNQILSSNMLANGKAVKEFEESIKVYLNSTDTMTQSSGTCALITILKLLDLKGKKDIVLPNYVCHSVYDAIVFAGLNPILCDVNRLGVITQESVSKVINKRSAAIIAVHTFGNICNIEDLKIFKLPIIEDACQAFGISKGDNLITGNMSDISFMSFHATKCLTTGEGGMISLNNKYLLPSCNIKKSIKKESIHISPMSDLQASLGIIQFNRYNEFKARRKKIRSFFLSSFKEKGIEVNNDNESEMWFRFCINSKNNYEEFKNHFISNGVETRRGVDQLLNRKYNLNQIEKKDFSESTMLYESNLSIPCYPALKDQEVNYISEIIKSL